MADTLTTIGVPTTAADELPAASPIGKVFRDIARGGIAGIIVGIVVAGLGGRLVMRLATILHEGAVGSTTENGNQIGDITMGGTLALLLFGGLLMGLIAGTTWVIVSTWIPGRGLARALLAAPVAMALGTPLLVQRTNPDFRLLDRDPAVVGMLVLLVGLLGFVIALVDDALDARLPRPSVGVGVATTAYLIVTLMGAILILPVLIAIMLTSNLYAAPIRAGWALLLVGLCTLSWWVLRAQGRVAPPRRLMIARQVALLIAVIMGIVTSLPHVSGAIGFGG